jgi:Glycosyl transferases group 1
MAETRIQNLWQLDPIWGHAPWRSAPTQIERVLHIHLSTPEEPQTSLCRALASLASPAGYQRVDWTALPAGERHKTVVAAAASLRPTLIFMQLQCPGVLSPDTIAEMRRVAATSELAIMTWCGDVGGTHGPFPAPGDNWAYELSVQCDLMLYTSMSQVRAHRSRGMHNASYLQIGYDEDRYFEGQEEELGSRFDVAFLGANYDERQWPGLPGNDFGLRRAAAAMMRKEFGARFGLFGCGWGPVANHVPPAQSGDVYRRSHIVLSISNCSFQERYSSDRLLRGLACGGAVLMKSFDDWRSFGLVHGESVLTWDTVEEALALARAWLDPARREELRELGRRGARLVREYHSWGIRMQELCPLIAAVRGVMPEVTRPW